MYKAIYVFLAGVTIGISASHATGQIVPPVGFAVDQIAPRLDNSTPRIAAVANPSFGVGVVTSTVSNGILIVRRLSQGTQSLMSSLPGFAPTAYVIQSRFSIIPEFGNDLYVCVALSDDINRVGRLYRFAANGTNTIIGQWPGIAFLFDFAPSPFTPGLYGWDSVDIGGEDIVRVSENYQLIELINEGNPPGISDLDISGMAFDSTGLYGSQLLFANWETETNRATIERLNHTLTWSQLGPVLSTNQREYRDLCISTGGAIEQKLFAADRVSNSILYVAPDGAQTTWASGFLAIESISTAPDGNAMYVSDFNGVYRIRPIANEPGPTILSVEPSLPTPGSFTNPGGLTFARIIWSNAVQFNPSDISIINGASQSFGFTATGSGSNIMLISFGQPLINDTITITINDTVVSLTGVAIDGDGNGIAGADAVISFQHSAVCCTPSDVNCDGSVDGLDIQGFVDALLAP